MKRDTAKATAVSSPTIAVEPSMKRPAELAASISTLAHSSMTLPLTLMKPGLTVWANTQWHPRGESSHLKTLQHRCEAHAPTGSRMNTLNAEPCGFTWVNMPGTRSAE